MLNYDADFEFDMVTKAAWVMSQQAILKASLNSGAAEQAAKFNAAQKARAAKLAGK